MPNSFDGETTGEITIDGEVVSEVTMDGEVVWTAVEPGPVLIDDFERSTLQYYTGATGAYSLSTARSTSGTQSLYSSGENYERIATFEDDGLHIPGPGELIEFDVYTEADQSFQFCIAHEGTTNRLICTLSTGTGSQFYLDERIGDVWNSVFHTGASIPTGQWLTVRLLWDSGNQFFEGEIYDLNGNFVAGDNGSTPAPVNIPANNGFAFESLRGARYVDNLRYTEQSTGVGGGQYPGTGDVFAQDGRPLPNDDGPFGAYEGDVGGYWNNTFTDRFTGGALDTTKWSIGFGWGRSHGSALEWVRDSDVWVDAATDRLVLRLDRDDDYNLLKSTETERQNNGWYSGAVNTRNKFSQQHGYFEASVKAPEPVVGTIPAFWSKPNNEDWPPELDFMEQYDDPLFTGHTIHYLDDGGVKRENDVYRTYDEPISNQFHVFGCEWDAERVTWYHNGKIIGRSSAGNGTLTGQLNYGQPFYMLLTCHLGHSGIGTNPTQYTNWPYTWEVDWVQAWEKTDTAPWL